MSALHPATRTRRAVADHAWGVALRLKTFGYSELSVEAKIGMERATEIVRGWLREGSVSEVPSTTKRKMYRADQDFVRLPDRTPEDNMWTAMRRLRAFNPSTIAAHATTDEIKVTVEEAAAYCRALLDAEYLRVSRRAAPNMKREAEYVLANETGPKAPVPARVRALRDPNTGRVILLGERT
jgi:hypothetical protein